MEDFISWHRPQFGRDNFRIKKHLKRQNGEWVREWDGGSGGGGMKWQS